MEKTIMVVEGGGQGFRMAKVCGTKIGPVSIQKGPINGIQDLIYIIQDDLPPKGVDGIAVSVAGVIENHSLVKISPNIHFLDGVDLGQEIFRATGLSSYVANDMEAAATGMSQLFPRLGYFAGITWSSGIGMRIFKGGQILSDSEGGHVCIDHSPFAPLCGCGRRGCVEAIAGGKAVERRIASETIGTRGLIIISRESLSASLDQAYLRQEEWANDIYRLIKIGMGRYLAALQTILHLPAIVWKGTFAQKALRLPGVEEAIRAEMRRNLMNPAWEGDLKFFFVPGPPELPPDGESFIGAAKLAVSFMEK